MSQTSLKPFNVRVLSAVKTFYEGEAISVSAVNGLGPFDVLYGHIKYVSLLSTGELVVDIGSQKLRFSVSGGLIQVADNTATIFIDIT